MAGRLRRIIMGESAAERERRESLDAWKAAGTAVDAVNGGMGYLARSSRWHRLLMSAQSPFGEVTLYLPENFGFREIESCARVFGQDYAVAEMRRLALDESKYPELFALLETASEYDDARKEIAARGDFKDETMRQLDATHTQALELFFSTAAQLRPLRLAIVEVETTRQIGGDSPALREQLEALESAVAELQVTLDDGMGGLRAVADAWHASLGEMEETEATQAALARTETTTNSLTASKDHQISIQASAEVLREHTFGATAAAQRKIEEQRAIRRDM